MCERDARSCGGIQPFGRLDKIHSHPFAFDVNASKFQLRADMTLFGCLAKESARFQQILTHTSTGEVAASQSMPRLNEVLLGGEGIPLGSLLVILSHAITPFVAKSKTELGRCITLPGGLLEPKKCLGQIFVAPFALGQKACKIDLGFGKSLIR